MKSSVLETLISCRKCELTAISLKDQRIKYFSWSEKFKPQKVKLLWIVDVPHDVTSYLGFYHPELNKDDLLFMQMMKALSIPVTKKKSESLIRFAEMGYYLLDTVKCPLYQLKLEDKKIMFHNCSQLLKEHVLAINPDKIVITKTDNSDSIISSLKDAGMKDRIISQNIFTWPIAGKTKKFRDSIDFFNKQITQTPTSTGPSAVESVPTFTGLTGSITVNNITEKDAEKHQLRINKENIDLFPSERNCKTAVFPITLICNKAEYSCNYCIGSKDGKTRSGVIRLGSTLANQLRITAGSYLIISKIAKNRYIIEKK